MLQNVLFSNKNMRTATRYKNPESVDMTLRPYPSRLHEDKLPRKAIEIKRKSCLWPQIPAHAEMTLGGHGMTMWGNILDCRVVSDEPPRNDGRAQ